MSEDQSIYQCEEPILTTNTLEAIPPYLAYVGINKAARLIGKGKTQIYNDIKAQKLSWHIEDGKKLLRISDLDRVYGLKPDTSTKVDHQNQNIPHKPEQQTTSLTTETLIELALLKQQVKEQSEQIRHRDEQIQDLRRNRDQLLDQNNRLTLLLPAPQANAPEPSNPAPAKPSLLSRLFSRGNA